MDARDSDAAQTTLRPFAPVHSKGDYDGAMTQYLKTIGRLEPSYVIRKVRTQVQKHTTCTGIHGHSRLFFSAVHGPTLLSLFSPADLAFPSHYVSPSRLLFFFPFSCIQFLDAQRIRNLTSYLQELHEQGVANADHTTLLLNCYTKLKDNERLDAFIKVWHARQTQRWTPRQAWLTVGARTACLPTS